MNDRWVEAPDGICCLLHSLGLGGATWQWIRLLATHVERGGRATIFAQTGRLVEVARAAGIEVVPVEWGENGDQGRIWRAAAGHDLAIVQCEQGPLDVFARALEECGRAALAVHGAPQTMERWLAPPLPMKLRRAVERAAAEPDAVVLVRGEAHRRKVESAYGLAAGALRILPPSVPLDALPFHPVVDPPREVLAMTRLAPEKMPIVRVAVGLVRERLAAGQDCRLTIAGAGACRPEAIELCERSLRPGSWRLEMAPRDPTKRLAECDLVVAQGTTTLEAAALGRRVVVARSLGVRGASAAVLTPERYDQAARDPFGDPPVSEDLALLWAETLALDEPALTTLRHLVETHNSPEAAERALEAALSDAKRTASKTAACPPPRRGSGPVCRAR